MKRLIETMVLVGALLAGMAAVVRAADDVVASPSVTFTNIRDEAVVYVSDETYYQSTTLVFTNCQVYSDTAGAVIQGLSNVTVDVSIGTVATNVDYVGSVTSITGGTWSASITVPSFVGAPQVQVKLTDSLTNSYIYPWKVIRTKVGM